jgi:hypothetical protein
MKRFVWVIVIILLSAQVLALGITPANRQLDFEPGAEKTIAYRIYNTEQKDFTAHLNITGSLKEYMTLDQEEILFTKEDKVKSFALTIKFPQEMPSDASAKIEIIGVPKDASATLTLSASLGIMGATGAVVSEPQQIEERIDEEETIEESGNLLPIVAWLMLLMVAGNVVFFSYKKARALPELTPPDLSVQNSIQPQTNQQPLLNQVQQSYIVQDNAQEQYTGQLEQAIQQPVQPRGLYFADGSPVKSVSELLYFVQNVPEDVFSNYVNQQTNEVAVWLDSYLKEPKLALRVYDTLSRQEIMQALTFHLMQVKAQEEKDKHAAELRMEIERLKSDLDFI